MLQPLSESSYLHYTCAAACVRRYLPNQTSPNLVVLLHPSCKSSALLHPWTSEKGASQNPACKPLLGPAFSAPSDSMAHRPEGKRLAQMRSLPPAKIDYPPHEMTYVRTPTGSHKTSGVSKDPD